MTFTPGKMASDNNSEGYGNWYNSGGYVHLKASRAAKEVGYNQYRYGGTPVFKDAYPVNKPGQITITSTYSAGLELGYSFTNGFSLDNITYEENTNLGLNIGYSYSKSYTNTEPALSAQKNAEDTEKFEWKYTYNTPRNETHHLYMGYLFEMNNTGHDLFEGDLAFRYDYEMSVSDKGWWIFENKNSFKWFSYHNYY